MKQLVGDRIRKLRERKGLLPGELASQLGVTSTTVYNWEQGRNLPACELLPQLAKALNTTIDHLLRFGSKDQIMQSITKYYFNQSLEEYTRAIDLAKLSDEIDPDAMLEFRLLSMEMTHIIHQAINLMSRFDTFLESYGEQNHQLAIRTHRQKLQLQILYLGANVVLDQLKKDVESNPSFLTCYNLINGFLMSGHNKEALQLCEKAQVEFPSQEIDIILAECHWRVGETELATHSLWKILGNRINYDAATLIRAHELLYRILLQNQETDQIIELLKDSLDWLPGEFAKDGYDMIQAKRKLKERMKRITKQV